MQTSFASSGALMTSAIVAGEGNAGVVDAPLRTVDRPTARRGEMPRTSLRERVRRLLFIVVPVVMAVAGAGFYLAEEPYVSTDDAFVRAAKESINARVCRPGGRNRRQDNQHVQRGQLLFRIDPEPYQIAVDQAEARLASARLQIDELKATYRQQLAELQSARIPRTSTSASMTRKKALVT